jgi:hypothetical protein
MGRPDVAVRRPGSLPRSFVGLSAAVGSVRRLRAGDCSAGYLDLGRIAGITSALTRTRAWFAWCLTMARGAVKGG